MAVHALITLKVKSVCRSETSFIFQKENVMCVNAFGFLQALLGPSQESVCSNALVRMY